MWKRAFSLVIVVLLLVHLAGFYLYFIVRLGELRMEMRDKVAELPDEELDSITIPRAEFRNSWLEEREMKWKGKMYDIARVESVGEDMRIFCLHDEDEDGLLNILAAVVETGRQDTRQAPHVLIDFFALKYVVTSVILPSTAESQLDFHETAYRESVSSFTPDLLSPPPRS